MAFQQKLFAARFYLCTSFAWNVETANTTRLSPFFSFFSFFFNLRSSVYYLAAERKPKKQRPHLTRNNVLHVPLLLAGVAKPWKKNQTESKEGDFPHASKLR